MSHLPALGALRLAFADGDDAGVADRDYHGHDHGHDDGHSHHGEHHSHDFFI